MSGRVASLPWFFLSECYAQNIEYKAIAHARLNLALKTYRRYADVNHTRLKSKEQSLEQKSLK